MYKKLNYFILLVTSSLITNINASTIEEKILNNKENFSEVALKIWSHAEMGYQ